MDELNESLNLGNIITQNWEFHANERVTWRKKTRDGKVTFKNFQLSGFFFKVYQILQVI